MQHQAQSGGQQVDFAQLVKKLPLPPDFTPPTELVFGPLRARAISRLDLDDDVRGINASLELIRSTRGGDWPSEPVTAEVNYVDLVWHELEFRDGYSFSFAVYQSDGTYIGCCYFYPMGRRTPLTEALLAHDVDVSWWVTPAAYKRGHYATLYEASRQWATVDYPFTNPYFSNAQIPAPKDD